MAGAAEPAAGPDVDGKGVVASFGVLIVESAGFPDAACLSLSLDAALSSAADAAAAAVGPGILVLSPSLQVLLYGCVRYSVFSSVYSVEPARAWM